MTEVTLTLRVPDTFTEADIENTIKAMCDSFKPVGHKFPGLDRMSVFDKIRTWAKAKGILDHGDPKTQCVKLMEEVGELAKAILKNDKPEIVDAIGDIAVVLTSEAYFAGIKIEDCIESAYAVIAKRKGTMEHGNFVKES